MKYGRKIVLHQKAFINTMAILLCIETTTEICSVAISNNNQLLALEEVNLNNSHAKLLMSLIDKALLTANVSLNAINAVCFSEGPGSYTGLRIGLSTAKGLCYALDKKLIHVSTLQSIAWGMRKEKLLDAYYCPLIDAKRMEVYTAIYDTHLALIEDVKSKIITEDTFTEIAKEHTLVLAGNGLDKCKKVLQSTPNLIFINIQTSAAYMIELAYEKYEKQQFENVAYVEPFYLKEFIAGKPRVKGLY